MLAHHTCVFCFTKRCCQIIFEWVFVLVTERIHLMERCLYLAYRCPTKSFRHKSEIHEQFAEDHPSEMIAIELILLGQSHNTCAIVWRKIGQLDIGQFGIFSWSIVSLGMKHHRSLQYHGILRDTNYHKKYNAIL